jgi:tRNA 2-thiouridine synthesizing protein D
MTGMLSHRRRCASDLPAESLPWQALRDANVGCVQANNRSRAMHFVISATWGPTDPTRAMLPFIFAASAVQAGDEVTLMLFHDAVYMAVEGAGAKLVPVGPPNRYEEVAAHPKATLWACKPCVEVRGLAGAPLDRRIKLGGMNEFHAAAKGADARVINY